MTIFFSLVYTYSYGQNTSYDEVDTLVTDFLEQLNSGKVDTICIYEDYFIGGSLPVNDDQDGCEYLYATTYILWLKQGKTFLSKKDNCFNYSTLEISSPHMWDIFFRDQTNIKNEKVRPFQTVYYEKGKKIVATTVIDHSEHQNIRMIVGYDTTMMAFDSFDFQQQSAFGDKKEININYEHNNNLKGKQFLDELVQTVKDIEKKKLLTKTRLQNETLKEALDEE